LKEYIAEEVGATTDCMGCGRQFTLVANHGRAAWQIISATLAVLLLIGGVAGRYYLRAKRSEARFHAAQNAAERQRLAAQVDNDDN
jgi:hypothetical protein